jgi:hypothetical protein
MSIFYLSPFTVDDTGERTNEARRMSICRWLALSEWGRVYKSFLESPQSSWEGFHAAVLGIHNRRTFFVISNREEGSGTLRDEYPL